MLFSANNSSVAAATDLGHRSQCARDPRQLSRNAIRQPPPTDEPLQHDSDISNQCRHGGSVFTRGLAPTTV